MNKSKKLIETIYNKTPSDDTSSIMGNISKLLYQFQTSPQKLPKAANVLEKQALGCLKVLNMAQVQLTVTIFTELIKGTREHLSLFEDVIASVTTAYCAHPSVEVRRSGISIFIAYVDVLDATSAPASRLDFFSYAAQFMKFAKLPTGAAANNSLKVAAFQGLSACVRAFELRNAMETFIGKLGMDTVSIILENVHSFPAKKPVEKGNDAKNEGDDAPSGKPKKAKKEAESGASEDGGADEGAKEIGGAATQCLKDLVERLESMAIASLVDNVLQYFDAKNTWATNSSDYVENCLLTILRSIKSTNRYLMAVAIVQRIEKIASPADTPPEVRARMFSCLEKVYTEATGLFPSVLLAAMRHLAASIAAATAGASGEAEFQKHLIQVVSKVAGKVTLSATKIEGVELVIARAAEHMKAVGSKGKGGSGAETEIVVAFLDLASELFATVKRPFSRRPNDAVVASLLKFSEVESAPEVRLGALKLLEIVLSCGQNDAILKHSSAPLAGSDDFVASISLDDPAVTNGVGVRDTLLRSLALPSNRPQHVVAIASILVVLLYRLQDREIPFLVPFLFEVQSSACKAPRASSLDRARMALVAAGLTAIARLYGVDSLRSLASDALSALDAAGLASKELKVDPEKVCPIAQAHSKWRKPYESDGPMMKRAFDREKVVGILAGVKRLSRGYVDFESLLGAEWKAVVSGDVSIEMRVGKGKPGDAKGKAGKKKAAGRRKKAQSSDSDSESESDSSSESESDSDESVGKSVDGGESRSHLVSLTKLSSYSVSISSDSIAEIPFADCDAEEIVFPVVKKSDIVSYKNVVDVLECKKSAADILGEKKNRGAVAVDNDDGGDALSFEKIAAACTEYRAATRESFALVCEDISEDPEECKTDLLGDEKVADPDLLNPEKNPNVDMDTFVETRQHFPQIFQVTKE